MCRPHMVCDGEELASRGVGEPGTDREQQASAEAVCHILEVP